MNRSTRRTLLALLTPALSLVAPTNAHADTAEAPSGLALDRVSTEGAHLAATHLACGSPRARRYLRRTLRSMELRRWGLITKNLNDDTIDLVADAVYAAASSGRSDPNVDVLRKFVDSPDAPRPGACDEEAVRRTLDRADEEPIETDVDRCTRRPLVERRRDPACALAAAVRAGLDGDVATAQINVADAIAATTFDVLYTGKALNEPQKDALFEHVAYELREVLTTEANDETIDTDVLRAFSHMDLDTIRSWRCPDADLVKDLAEGARDPQDAFCSATRADLETEKVAVTLATPSGETRTLNLTGLLHAVSTAAHQASHDGEAEGARQPHKEEEDRDAHAAEALLCSLPLAAKDKPLLDCERGALRVAKAATFKLTVGSATWNLVVTPPGRVKVESPSHLGLAALVDGSLEALHLRANIASLIHDKLLGDEPTAESLRELATVALRLRRVALALDDSVTSSDAHAYILAPLEALPALLPKFGPNTEPSLSHDHRCGAADASVVDRMRCAASGSLRRIIIAAEDGQVSDLASRVASLVGPRPARTCTGLAGARLLEAFASAVPDAHGGPDDPHARALASEQIHSAAEELGRCAPGERDPAFRVSLYPVPGVRFSWNSAYVNAFGADGFRVVPSLDFVSARLRLSGPSSPVRVGLMASVFDLAAPLSELAMRDGTKQYDRQEMVWLDAIRPRLDFSFGVPSIARHLFVSGGFALRTVAPYRGGGGKPSSTMTYLAVGTPGGATAESFASFIEYSLALRYAF